MEIKISNEQIMEALKDHIEENYGDQIASVLKNTIEKEVSALVGEKIKEKIEPIALDVLRKGKFIIHTGNASYYTSEDKIDKLVEYFVKKYLNDPHYVYSKDAQYPKDRYMRSSSGGSYNSLIELIIQDNIRRVTTQEFKPQIDEAIDKFLVDRDMIAKIIGSKMQQFFEEKIKQSK